jgi:hypothetical protein
MFADHIMVPIPFLLVVGGLIFVVLLFSFYIFPDIICPSVPDTGGQTDAKDPIRGFCSVFK